MPFKVYVICTVTEPINFGQLDGIADVAWKVGLNTTMTAFIFSSSGKTRDHFLAALCAESAEMNMVTFIIFTLLCFFVCHVKNLS